MEETQKPRWPSQSTSKLVFAEVTKYYQATFEWLKVHVSSSSCTPFHNPKMFPQEAVPSQQEPGRAPAPLLIGVRLFSFNFAASDVCLCNFQFNELFTSRLSFHLSFQVSASFCSILFLLLLCLLFTLCNSFWRRWLLTKSSRIEPCSADTAMQASSLTPLWLTHQTLSWVKVTLITSMNVYAAGNALQWKSKDLIHLWHSPPTPNWETT